MKNAPIPTLLVILQLVTNHANHNIVAYESTGVHDLLRLDTKWGLLRDLLTKHVTCCEVADAELVTDARCLSAFAYRFFFKEKKEYVSIF